MLTTVEIKVNSRSLFFGMILPVIFLGVVQAQNQISSKSSTFENEIIGSMNLEIRKLQEIIGENDIVGKKKNDEFGTNVALSADGKVLAVGAPDKESEFTANPGSGYVRVYQQVNETWLQIGDDLDGESEAILFGSSVALSTDGNVLAVGATNFKKGAGKVGVYQNVNATWIQVGDHIDGEGDLDKFGTSVALSSDGNVLAIGDPNHGSKNVGYVRIYKNVNATWVQVGNDIDGTYDYDHSGASVELSADGNVLAVGAKGFWGRTYIGKVRLYQNVNASWVQIGNDINGDD